MGFGAELVGRSRTPTKVMMHRKCSGPIQLTSAKYFVGAFKLALDASTVHTNRELLTFEGKGAYLDLQNVTTT